MSEAREATSQSHKTAMAVCLAEPSWHGVPAAVWIPGSPWLLLGAWNEGNPHQEPLPKGPGQRRVGTPLLVASSSTTASGEAGRD